MYLCLGIIADQPEVIQAIGITIEQYTRQFSPFYLITYKSLDDYISLIFKNIVFLIIPLNSAVFNTPFCII